MTAEQRAGLSDAALAMTQPCIDELIKDISRRVQKAGAITDTAEYQLYRAQALGESKKAIEQAVSKQIGISEEVIASLFEYVADKSLSLDENGSLKRMTEAYTRMTQSKTRELLWESFGPVLRVRKNKRIVSHPQPHRVGKYHAPHLRPDPHPHLPRDRLQGYHSEPEIPPEGSCSRADEAQDDSDTDNTDEGDHLCLTG